MVIALTAYDGKTLWEHRDRPTAWPDSARPRQNGTFYRNPYPDQQEQRTQRGADNVYRNPYQSIYRQGINEQGYSDPNEEYRRQDPFQQWNKNQPKPHDPTADDAYLEEVMPGAGR